jgi:hypothetical protein
MSSSLKGYTPALARHLGTSPAALYERQRVLVSAGLLHAAEGRGPGSGVRATAPAVALLLLSVLTTDRLTESEASVRALASAKPSASRCPFTRTTSFLDAFAAVLVTTGKAAGVTEIIVSRTAERAQIKYCHREKDGTHTMQISEFFGSRSKEPGISVSAVLSHSLLQQIASDVHAIVLEGFNSPAEVSQ